MDAMEFQTLRDSLLEPCDIGNLENFKLAHEKFIKIKLSNSYQYEMILTFSFQRAIESGSLNILKYLFAEHSDEFHQKKLLDLDDFFFATCMYNKPELTIFILEQNKSKNLRLDIDEAFKSAYQYELLDIIKTLIFDFNLKQSESINNCLTKELVINNEIKNMFILSLKNDLNEDLKINLDNKNNKKVKL